MYTTRGDMGSFDSDGARLAVDYGMPEETRLAAYWRRTVTAQYVRVPGFSNYKFRKRNRVIEVRKDGTNHNLTVKWFDPNNIRCGRYFVMWKDGEKHRISLNDERFSNNGE